jgi:hypothetical protein
MEDAWPSGASHTTSASVSDWREEVERFKEHVYHYHGVDRNGLELLHDGPVKVLRVANKEQFAEALHDWAESIRWENDFSERNREFLSERQ